MRRKKHKHTRKTVRLFRIQFGFRQPFKVLVDGNFVHAMQQLRMKPPSELIPKLLGGTCRLFTTSCIQHELKKLGSDFLEARQASKQLLLHKCDHTSRPCTPSECILSLVGSDNSNHFFVATQDKHLRNALLKIPSGAVINCSSNGLHLAQPSTKQEAAVAAAETERRVVPTQEAAVLKPLLGKRTAAQLQYNDSKFVRKRAKAPNPLSCRPKQVKERTRRAPASGSAGGDTGSAGGEEAHARGGGVERADSVQDMSEKGKGHAIKHKARKRARKASKPAAD